MQFKEIPLTLFKLAPTHEVRINNALKVMVHKRVGFYAVSPERMDQLIKAEVIQNDLSIRLYTAYDCAISALGLCGNSDAKKYLEEIIKCYSED